MTTIETSATADQTNAEIRTAVEAATNSNVFTDADHSKLNAIEASATADQTNAEIRTAVEAASDSNVFTDADHTKLNAIEASANVTDTANVVAALTAGTNITIASNGTIASTDTNTTYSVGDGGLTQNNFTNADHTKLNGIETSATADQTAAQIKALLVNGLTATHLAAGSVGASEIGNDVVNSQHYAAGSIDNEHIADNAVNSEHYADGSIDRAHLANDIIDGTKIANDVINSEHYVAGSVDREHLANDIIDSTKIANDVINSEHYVAGSIDREHLANDIIDSTKIADDVINSEHYVSNSIDALHLNVSGNGSTSQFLRSDGDGTFTWATPTDTNTTYSVGDGGLSQINFTSADHTKLNGIAASANNYSFPYTVSASAGNNTIVQRSSGGYIFANYINTTANDVTSGVTKVMVETGNDNYIRHGSAAAIRTFLNVENGSTADQTSVSGSSGSCTGNAATVTQNHSDGGGNYPILWRSSGTTYYTDEVYITASTNKITATTFAGALVGNATTATNLTSGAKTIGGNLTVTGTLTSNGAANPVNRFNSSSGYSSLMIKSGDSAGYSYLFFNDASAENARIVAAANTLYLQAGASATNVATFAAGSAVITGDLTISNANDRPRMIFRDSTGGVRGEMYIGNTAASDADEDATYINTFGESVHIKGAFGVNSGGTEITRPSNTIAVFSHTDGYANVGVALVSGSGNSCSIYMGDPANPKIGAFTYANNTDTFSLSKTITVAGAVNKTGGTFKIDHPLPEKADTHHLVHSFTESPQADLLYSGTSELVDGAAEVNLDEFHGMTEGTFVALNRNIRVFTTNETDWEPIKGSVTGNILSISCQDASCSDTVSWMVIGERHDDSIKALEFTDEQGRVIVEPLKPEEPAQVQRTVSVPVMLDGEQVEALETIDVTESIKVIDGVAVLTAATTKEVLKPQFEYIGVVDVDGNPVYE